MNRAFINRESPEIHIVGLGVAEKPQFDVEALDALQQAELVVGSSRQLETVAEYIDQDKTHELPKLGKLKDLINEHLEQNAAGKVAVLASGDPLFYGIGRWFGKHFEKQALHYHPAVSSIQASCHALGLALQDVDVLSLHGRPLEKIRTRLRPNKTLAVLTDKHSYPKALAEECQQAGFDESQFWVCEKLGYSDQSVRQFSLSELLQTSLNDFDPLHVTVIEVKGKGGVLPVFPGIPDHHYLTGKEDGRGMITKREVRLAILSLLQPGDSDVIWDVGAGCGGVTVELAYWNPGAQVYAVEQNPERLEYLNANCHRFGVTSNCKVIAGRAPEALHDLPVANKIFIGGSDGELPGLLESLWANLPQDGLLVVSTVTEESKNILIEFCQHTGADCVETLEVAVSKGVFTSAELSSLASLEYQKKKAVTLFKFRKL